MPFYACGWLDVLHQECSIVIPACPETDSRLMEDHNPDFPVEVIEPFLEADDDPAFWRSAVNVLVADVELEIAEGRRHRNIFLNIGACSHWLRPHQTRWTASGGFAWPTGYGGKTQSRSGLPQFDWSVTLQRDARLQIWKPTSRIEGGKKLVLRAALPTRTMLHDQAAIHTIWPRGSPTMPTKKCVRFYGFRKEPQGWACVASLDHRPEKP